MIALLKKILSSKYKRSIKEKLGAPSLHWSLQNLKCCGYNPSFVIDIGAYEGYWTRDFLEVFPCAKVLMIEPQTSKSIKLKEVCNEFSNVSYQIVLLSSDDGKELYFHENETASHVDNCSNKFNKKIKSQSLDLLLQKSKLPYPNFLKLDVQGFELEILKGGATSLENAEFCLMEVSLLELDNSPLVLEVMNFMDIKGFQIYDICHFMRRPFDKALYQIDLMFIKKNSKLIREKRWN